MLTADQIKSSYSGYAGWNDSASIVANYLETGGEGKGNTPFALGRGDSSTISASNITAPVSVPYSSGSQESYISGLAGDLARERENLNKMVSSQKTTVDEKLKAAQAKETDVLNKIEPLTTPFREDLETTERERLHINENFEANQTLINELDTLLSEGNALIKQQQEVTGLSAIRNPRVQKTMDDVAARAGVIQAVINARNGQISVAENLIDRSANAIAADRKDQIDYYQTVLELNNRDIISLDSESKKLASTQLALKQDEVTNLEASVNKIKDLMIDPATAGLVGDAGIKLTDSIEQISSKMAKAVYAKDVRDMSNQITAEGGVAVTSPAGIPANQLKSFKDSKGVMHYYKMPAPKATVGTEGERSVSQVASIITTNNMNFSDAVVKFANQMSLSDIYSAYSQSKMFEQWGLPTENPNEVAALYKWARGEITKEEYDEMFPQ